MGLTTWNNYDLKELANKQVIWYNGQLEHIFWVTNYVLLGATKNISFSTKLLVIHNGMLNLFPEAECIIM